MSPSTIGIFIFVLIFTTIADYFLKKSSSLTNPFNSTQFIIGSVSYFIIAYLWIFLYKYIDFSVMGIIYSIGVAALAILVGTLFFHENLTWNRLVGLGFGIVAIYFLNR